MKAFLMYRDQDFDRERPLPPNEPDLRQDLELDTLFAAMAAGDDFLLKAATKAVLTSLAVDVDTIRYRQAILRDCLDNVEVIHRLYAISMEPIERKKHIYLAFGGRYPGSALSGSVNLLDALKAVLRELAAVGRDHGGKFRSEGFRNFFAMIAKELDDDYFGTIDDHLARLKFRNGVLISAQLGPGNRGRNYVLRKQVVEKWEWLKEKLGYGRPGYRFTLHPRDEAGFRALSEIRDRGLAAAAGTMLQSTDHILDFFAMLRAELAFYIGCINLRDRLAAKGATLCFPDPAPAEERRLSFEGLREPGLLLSLAGPVMANDLREAQTLIVVTGANQGGKSTFLRSVGVAQLMMQAGMFVPADSFSANVCDGLFTHYRREEDTGLRSGKFDEELRRMSGIVDEITANPMILFNESFAATNEREGSEIARQIVTALLEKRVKIVFVTHMYELASRLAKDDPEAIFLRAERGAGGRRTFRLVEGPPLQTSYGRDLYAQVFEETDEPLGLRMLADAPPLAE